MLRSLWVVGLAIGCGSRPAEPPPPPPPPAAPAPTSSARVESASPDAATTAPAAPRAAIDATDLRGYVRGLSGPEVRQGDGSIASVESTPRDEHIAELRFVVDDANGASHRFRLIVPRALPVPFDSGDRVRFRASASGGGPNRRTSLLLLAVDGTPLFAVDTAPEGWKVERGRRVATDRDGASYVQHAHEVVFTHAGTTRSVAPGSWARLGDFYVWGTAAVRDPRAGPLPPDYVGSWLDFAVVRAR